MAETAVQEAAQVEMIWLAPFLQVPKPEDGAELRYDAAAAQIVKDFFGLLVFGQNQWAGQPFELLPWETEAIDLFYGVQVLNDDGEWVRYRRFLYEEIAKKNGKSEFTAGLGLYHLLADGEERPNVGIFAADKQNADIIYQCAKYMVEHTAMSEPKHRPLVYCRDSVREIRTRFGGLMKVYSSDADTKHGFSYSAILCDEIHAWAGRAGHRLWDVLTAGSDAARQQQAVIVLTTAGDDPDRKSIGWTIHEQCRRILAWRRGEPERPMDADDPRWCPIMYGISILTGDDPDRIADINIFDEELWKTCNPSYGVTIKPRQFRAEAKAAKLSEAAERTFRWLRLNQWISTKDVGWLPLTLYDKTQIGPSDKAGREQWIRENLTGKICYGGLDLSATTDLTAFVLLFPPQAGLDTWVALFHAWRPLEGVLEAEQRDHVPYRDWERAGFIRLCPGDMIDYTMVEQTIYEAAELYDLQCVGTDPYLSRTLISRLMSPVNDAGQLKRAVQCIDIPQGIMHMSPPTKELERLIRGHQMLHVHNTAGRLCFGNCRCYVDGNENQKLMKDRSIGRIDITVAWVIALATATVMQGQAAFDKTKLEEDWGL